MSAPPALQIVPATVAPLLQHQPLPVGNGGPGHLGQRRCRPRDGPRRALSVPAYRERQDGVQHADARVASQGNFTGVSGHGVGRESRGFLRWARHARDPAVAGPLFRNVTERARDDDVGGDDQSNSVCNRGKIACRYLRCSGRGVASPWRSDLRLGIMTS